MLEFLVHKFIKDADAIDRPEVRKRYGFFSSIVGIICNIILFACKLAIGLIAGSISIVSDGVNNLSDCATCIVTMFGYKMAAKPADRDHPFGHGRMEYLTSLIIAAAILAVGFELLRSSFQKVLHPERVTFSFVALFVLVFSILIKVGMGFMNRKLGMKLSSSIMLATSKDSFSDVFATLATVIALVMSAFSDLPVDGIMGIVVSVMIMISGFGIVKDTVDQLLGQPADEKLVEKIRELVMENMFCHGMHDLIIHSYGPGNLIGSVHVEVDCHENIMEIHDAIDELERNIYDELQVHMTIHMDPIDYNDEKTNVCRDMMSEILREIDKGLTMHDFRIVSGPTHTNLIFDVLVPYECEKTEAQIKSEIQQKLSKMPDIYYTVITFDKGYC